MTIDGVMLEKGTEWSLSGLSGIVFIPRGERMHTASLQVGVLLSEKHTSGEALSRWIMEEYRRSPTKQLYARTGADEACKVGATSDGETVRGSVALHRCGAAKARAVCAEVDERLTDPSGSPCQVDDTACWQGLCDDGWTRRGAALQSILVQTLGPD